MTVANKRHDLIAVTVSDPREQTLPDVGFITLKDAETGEIVELDTRQPASPGDVPIAIIATGRHSGRSAEKSGRRSTRHPDRRGLSKKLPPVLPHAREEVPVMNYIANCRVPWPRLRGHEYVLLSDKHAHDKRGHGTNCKLEIAKPRPAPTGTMRSMVGWSVAVAIIVLLLFTSGCGQKSDNAQPSSTRKKSRPSVVERGPVKVTAEVQPAKARLSDEPVLTLTIEYESGVQIEKPPFGASHGKFRGPRFSRAAAKNPQRPGNHSAGLYPGANRRRANC